MLRSRVVRIAILSFVLVFTSGLASQLWSAGLQQAPSTGASPATPFWLAPAIDLIKFLVNKFKPDKNEKKQMAEKVAGLDSYAKDLEPLPQFLVDSREFKQRALELAKLVRTAAASEGSAEVLWKPIRTGIEDTSKAFAATYKRDDVRKKLVASLELQQAENQCRNGLDEMQKILQGAPDTAAASQKHHAVGRLETYLNPLTEGAQLPDYQVVVASYRMVEGYKQLVKDLKGSTEKSEAVPLFPSIQALAMIAGPGFSVRAAAGQPEFLEQMRAEISKPVTPPQWTLTLLETTGRVPAPSFPWGRLLTSVSGALAAGGLGGAAGATRLYAKRIKAIAGEMQLSDRTVEQLRKIRPLSFLG